VNDTAKVALILLAMSGLFYIAARRGKHPRGNNPFSRIQPGDAEPAGTGVNFNPAFVSTAATPDVLVTGEPETGNIVTGAICATARVMKPKKTKCGCGGH
jgi:hypothetical protein